MGQAEEKSSLFQHHLLIQFSCNIKPDLCKEMIREHCGRVNRVEMKSLC